MTYITIKELMEKYKTTRPTIYAWMNKGLPSYKFGKLRRFIEKEVDEWMNNNEQ